MNSKYKRRTFADVEAAAYAKGWTEGHEQARKEYNECWEIRKAQLRLERPSLRKLAWQRIKEIFSRSKDHDFQ